MALDVKVGSFAKTTSGAPTTQAITGVGFQPKALLLWTIGHTVETATAVHSDMGLGFSDGTNSRYITLASDDNEATSKTQRRCGADALCHSSFGSLHWRCDVDSFDADGFTLSFDTNDANADLIFYMALGGSDVANVAVGSFDSRSSAGSQSISGLGFEPSFLVFTSVAAPAASDESVSSHVIGSVGVSDGTNNAVIAAFDQDAQATTNSSMLARDDTAILHTSNTGAILNRARVTGLGADGFDLEWDESLVAYRCFYLAVGGPQAAVGTETKPTSATTKGTTGLGFTPDALGFLYTLAGSTYPQNDSGAAYGLGASDGAGHKAIGVGSEDNLATSNANRRSNGSNALVMVDSADTVDGLADVDSLDGDGFTLDWSVASATARRFIYFALAGAAGGWLTPGHTYQHRRWARHIVSYTA